MVASNLGTMINQNTEGMGCNNPVSPFYNVKLGGRPTPMEQEVEKNYLVHIESMVRISERALRFFREEEESFWQVFFFLYSISADHRDAYDNLDDALGSGNFFTDVPNTHRAPSENEHYEYSVALEDLVTSYDQFYPWAEKVFGELFATPNAVLTQAEVIRHGDDVMISLNFDYSTPLHSRATHV